MMRQTAHDLVQAAKKSVREYSVAEIDNQLRSTDTLLIDVREPDEYRQGHIAGAINIPRGMLEFRISGEPTLQDVSRPVVVYCKTSGRAALSIVAMQAMGFENVVSLAGGFDAWAAAGLPVAKPYEVLFE